jgi:hypothetical protein
VLPVPDEFESSRQAQVFAIIEKIDDDLWSGVLLDERLDPLREDTLYENYTRHASSPLLWRRGS